MTVHINPKLLPQRCCTNAQKKNENKVHLWGQLKGMGNVIICLKILAKQSLNTKKKLVFNSYLVGHILH
jgi:hypothetical protein